VGWLPEAELSLVLRDVHPRNPRSSSWSIPITVLGQFQDTGVESGRVLDTGRLLSNDTTDTR
jgi:hypothetical protein